MVQNLQPIPNPAAGFLRVFRAHVNVLVLIYKTLNGSRPGCLKERLFQRLFLVHVAPQGCGCEGEDSLCGHKVEGGPSLLGPHMEGLLGSFFASLLLVCKTGHPTWHSVVSWLVAWCFLEWF